MQSKFNKVGIIARTSREAGHEKVLESLRRVEAFMTSAQVNLVLEDATHDLLRPRTLPHCSLAEMAEVCDLVIAVGGDGNILGAGRVLAPAGVPILGINRGRLGFLADISPDEIEEKVGHVLSGDYVVEEHFLLEGEVGPPQDVKRASALNEVVLHAGVLPRMIEFDLFIDDQFVYNQHSDGLIISSPTGSTAYSLSAGGPIMHPSLDAIVLVPMFPHTLNSRPLVIAGNCEIRIVIGTDVGTNARISFDSQIDIDAEPGHVIVVRKQKDPLKLIHPPGHNFYEVCRSKLDWASRLGESPGD